MRDNLLSEILEALIVIRGLVVQKTKLISDCNRLLKDLLDGLLLESSENKRQFIRACIFGLQNHAEESKGRTCLVWIVILTLWIFYGFIRAQFVNVYFLLWVIVSIKDGMTHKKIIKGGMRMTVWGRRELIDLNEGGIIM